MEADVALVVLQLSETELPAVMTLGVPVICAVGAGVTTGGGGGGGGGVTFFLQPTIENVTTAIAAGRRVRNRRSNGLLLGRKTLEGSSHL